MSPYYFSINQPFPLTKPIIKTRTILNILIGAIGGGDGSSLTPLKAEIMLIFEEYIIHILTFHFNIVRVLCSKFES
ncbi:hypothetical protein PB01_16800 [Psychrobacillus glaciei]|uniref:Uncharacterized protein n=1 Tax=Psychrobacillus glaciei TaxID=2283160 RepID=A0A5J6SS53_9BACI|nr:hypothetical protein PB01_16800 [Psychrobacillus glaciei]